MAKKNPKNTERRAMVEKMRQEQARKERIRSRAVPLMMTDHDATAAMVAAALDLADL